MKHNQYKIIYNQNGSGPLDRKKIFTAEEICANKNINTMSIFHEIIDNNLLSKLDEQINYIYPLKIESYIKKKEKLMDIHQMFDIESNYIDPLNFFSLIYSQRKIPAFALAKKPEVIEKISKFDGKPIFIEENLSLENILDDFKNYRDEILNLEGIGSIMCSLLLEKYNKETKIKNEKEPQFFKENLVKEFDNAISIDEKIITDTFIYFQRNYTDIFNFIAKNIGVCFLAPKPQYYISLVKVEDQLYFPDEITDELYQEYKKLVYETLKDKIPELRYLEELTKLINNFNINKLNEDEMELKYKLKKRDKEINDLLEIISDFTNKIKLIKETRAKQQKTTSTVSEAEQNITDIVSNTVTNVVDKVVETGGEVEPEDEYPIEEVDYNDTELYPLYDKIRLLKYEVNTQIFNINDYIGRLSTIENLKDNDYKNKTEKKFIDDKLTQEILQIQSKETYKLNSEEYVLRLKKCIQDNKNILIPVSLYDLTSFTDSAELNDVGTAILAKEKTSILIRAHANAVFINTENLTYEHFEPHGSLAKYNKNLTESKIQELHSRIFSKIVPDKEFKFINRNQFCLDLEGPQLLDKSAYCLIHSCYYMFLRILNPNLSLQEIEKMTTSKENPLMSTGDIDETSAEYLSQKYIQLNGEEIKTRLEKFMLWLKDFYMFHNNDPFKMAS